MSDGVPVGSLAASFLTSGWGAPAIPLPPPVLLPLSLNPGSSGGEAGRGSGERGGGRLGGHGTKDGNLGL